MSTFAKVSVPCPACGVTTPARLAESANAGRHPAFRAQVLDGTFMRVRCGGCGAHTVVERELLYTDLRRGQLIGVFSTELRADGASIDAGFRTVMEALAAEPGLAGSTITLRRVVFGYAELREKLVGADAGLDDRVIEALKLVLLARTGWMTAGSRGLLLVAAEADTLVFEQCGVTGPEGRAVVARVPRVLADRLAADLPALATFLPVPADASWVSVHRLAAIAVQIPPASTHA
ncbi:MAG: CpXC domain-containing protein [Pseudomonadota bacterium]|nr:CpXC domain-containing protein [Pseudomonadota bacterium]